MEPAASLGVESDSTDPTADSRGWHFAAPEYYTLAIIISVAIATYIFVTGDAQSERLLTPALVAAIMVVNLVPAMALIVLVGSRIARFAQGNGAASARLVIDNHGLLQVQAQRLADGAGHEIGGAAGREGHDHLDRRVGIALVRCGPSGCGGQQRYRYGCGRLPQELSSWYLYLFVIHVWLSLEWRMPGMCTPGQCTHAGRPRHPVIFI